MNSLSIKKLKQSSFELHFQIRPVEEGVENPPPPFRPLEFEHTLSDQSFSFMTRFLPMHFYDLSFNNKNTLIELLALSVAESSLLRRMGHSAHASVDATAALERKDGTGGRVGARMDARKRREREKETMQHPISPRHLGPNYRQVPVLPAGDGAIIHLE